MYLIWKRRSYILYWLFQLSNPIKTKAKKLQNDFTFGAQRHRNQQQRPWVRWCAIRKWEWRFVVNIQKLKKKTNLTRDRQYCIALSCVCARSFTLCKQKWNQTARKSAMNYLRYTAYGWLLTRCSFWSFAWLTLSLAVSLCLVCVCVFCFRIDIVC